MKKNYVKTVLCVPVFLWIMGAFILFAQEVKAEAADLNLRPMQAKGALM